MRRALRGAHTRRVETSQAADRRRRADAVLWAAGVAWVGALAALPAALLLDVLGTVLVAFLAVLDPDVADADPTGWVLTVALTAMGTCLVTAVGAARVLVTTPGSSAPPWLVGTLSGLLGWAAGAGVGWLALRG